MSYAVTTRNGSETRDHQEFVTLLKAKAFGAAKLREFGARVNNVTIYMPDYAPSLHGALKNNRVS